MALKITEENYNKVVETDKLVVIDFWAEWCGPCQKLSPVISELAEEYKDTVVIGKCDVEENNGIAIQFAIRNIPTIVFIKNKTVVDKLVGAVPADTIREKIDSLS